MQDDQFPVPGGEGIQGLPEHLFLLVFQIDAFRCVGIREEIQCLLSRLVFLPSAVINPKVSANPQQPVAKGGYIVGKT